MLARIRGRLGRNTMALLVSNGGSALLSFGLSVLIGRWLGESGLGIYASVLAWVFPLSLITEFGLGTLITRDVASEPQQAHAYLRASVSARLLIGGGLLALVWWSAPLLSDNASIVQGLRLSSPLIVILPFYSSFTAIFRVRQIMQPIAYLNLSMLVGQVTLTALVLVRGGDIMSVLAVNVLTSAGQLALAWVVYRRGFYQATTARISLKPILRAAMPFAVAAVLAAVQSRAVIILLEQFSTTSAVGYYAAASRFVEAGRMLPHAFFDALFPLLAGLASTPLQLERVFRRMIAGLTLFGVLFGIGITLSAMPLITLSYGETFAPSMPVLIVLAWGLLPLLLKSGRTLYWYAQGAESFVNRITALVLVIQIALGIVFIPRYGVMGAAVVVVISEIFATLLLFMRRP
ncbi:MAG: oligosaccharide flippase family protein [Anaerolineae bacterium]